MAKSLAILLLSYALNLVALGQQQRFHPDEAFFMTFARNAAVNGAWLLPGALDKPPLTMYMNAAALMLFAVDTNAAGVLDLDVYKGEFAARITGVWVAALWVAALMRLAFRLFHDRRVAWCAGLLAALSPYTLAFSPTAFTDMPMLLCATLALGLAAQGRFAWAGVAALLAFAAKPQAVFFAPLLLFFARTPNGASTKTIIQMLLPLCIGGALLYAWDAARPETSVFTLGAANNLTETLLVTWADLPARLAAWWDFVGVIFGHGVLTVCMLIIGAWACWRQNSTTRFILLWLIGYALFHVCVNVNIYDRYVLLALPLVCIVAALGWVALWGHVRHVGRGLLRAIFPLMFGLALLGTHGIGGDQGEHNGIDELAAYLNAKPVATVIYDRWLGWQLGYYMGQWTNKRRVYYPTPQALANGARALPEIGTRYFIAPEGVAYGAWLDALREAGFGVQPDAQIGHFVVYALTPP